MLVWLKQMFGRTKAGTTDLDGARQQLLVDLSASLDCEFRQEVQGGECEPETPTKLQQLKAAISSQRRNSQPLGHHNRKNRERGHACEQVTWVRLIKGVDNRHMQVLFQLQCNLRRHSHPLLEQSMQQACIDSASHSHTFFIAAHDCDRTSAAAMVADLTTIPQQG